MKALVCGDAMQDHYWRGDVRRISPEGPVPVLAVTETEHRDGAAANIANNIEAMGVQCERLFGRSKERIQKIRLMARNQHFARVDFDHPQEPIECDAAYEDALRRCGVVVFADYGKGSLANIQALIAAARVLNRTVLVDPKGHDFARYRDATVIKPNHEEMRELVGGWTSQDELDFKARQFLLQSGIESILLTQAADGMTLYTRSSTTHLAAEAGEIVDISGAGEAALSAFAATICKGGDMLAALRYASKAAALACGSFGTTVVTEEQVFGID